MFTRQFNFRERQHWQCNFNCKGATKLLRRSITFQVMGGEQRLEPSQTPNDHHGAGGV